MSTYHEELKKTWWANLPIGHHVHVRLAAGAFVRCEVVQISQGSKYLLAYDTVVVDGVDEYAVSKKIGYDLSYWYTGQKKNLPDWYTELPNRTHMYRPGVEHIFESPWYAYKNEISSPVGEMGMLLFEGLEEEAHAYSTQAVCHAQEVSEKHVSWDKKYTTFMEDYHGQKREPKIYGSAAITPTSSTTSSSAKSLEVLELIPTFTEMQFDNEVGEEIHVIHTKRKRALVLSIVLAVCTGLVIPTFGLISGAILAFAMFAIAAFVHIKLYQEGKALIHKKPPTMFEQLKLYLSQKDALGAPEVSAAMNDAQQALQGLQKVPGIKSEDLNSIAELTRVRLNHAIALAYLETQKSELAQDVYDAYHTKLTEESKLLADKVANARQSIVQLRLNSMMNKVLGSHSDFEHLPTLLAVQQELEGSELVAPSKDQVQTKQL